MKVKIDYLDTTETSGNSTENTTDTGNEQTRRHVICLSEVEDETCCHVLNPLKSRNDDDGKPANDALQ